MESHASLLRSMVGELQEDLQLVLTGQGDGAPAETAKVRLVDIVDLSGRHALVQSAADHLSEAVDRILEVQSQAVEAGALIGDEQSSRAVHLLKDPLAELTAAVHKLP